MSYFQDHDDLEKPDSSVKRVADWLTNLESRLYYGYLSLHFILTPLNEFNKHFQADKSMIGYLHTEMMKLLPLLLAKFVSTMVIRATNDITNLNFKATNNQLTEEVGMANNMDLPSEKTISFFKHARAFYVEVREKVIQEFPFKDETQKTLSFVDPEKRDSIQAQSVVQLAGRFRLSDNGERLIDQDHDHQLSPAVDLPKYDVEETRFDGFWLSELGEKQAS